MRVITSFVFGLFVVAASVYAQAPPPDFEKAEEARGAAIRAGDEQGFARYTTDDFFAVSAEGAVLTKADRMAAIKGNKLGTAIQPSDRKVRVYGDTVIVSTVQNPDSPTRFTTVWVKQNGMWKVASVHQTRITKKP